MKIAKILVVEDEAIIAKDLQLRLKHMGYDVPKIASNGEAAIDISQDILPDLILMDVMMPGKLNGIDTAKQILSERDVPVIYLSAYTDKMLSDSAKETEPFGYLSKPVSDFDLRNTIEMALYKHSAEKALRQEKEFTEKAINAQIDTFFVYDPNTGKAIRWNNKFKEISGYTDEEIAELKAPDAYYSQEDLENAAVATNDVLIKGQGTIEMSLICKDGRRVPTEYVASAIRDEEKQIKYIISIGRDISERKRAEERIKQINSLKEDLLGTGSLDEKLKRITDGVVTIFDADFARIWVIKPGDICNSGCFHAEATDDIHTCRYRDRCLFLMASSGRYLHIDGTHKRVPYGCYKIGRIAAGESPKYITNDVTHDQRIHDKEWVRKLELVSFAGYRLLSEKKDIVGVLGLFSKHPITTDEDGLIEGISNTAAQVIQTAKAVEALKESEKAEEKQTVFQKAIEITSDAINVVSPDGEIIYTNNAFDKLFGYKKGELIGKNISVINAEPKEKTVKDIMESIITKRLWEGEVLNIRKDGTEFVSYAIVKPMRDESGNITSIASFQHEIIERKI